MRYNVETNHGTALVTTTFSQVGATAFVEWGRLTRAGSIEYVFAGPIELQASDGISEEVTAQLAITHFDRTERPNNGAVLHFKIDDIEPNKALRLIPLTQ